jgi:hypothetical protein
MRGAGYSHALPMGLVNNGVLLFCGHCRRTVSHGRVGPNAGGVDFDEISPILELYPHLLSPLPWRVNEVKVTGAGDRSPYTFCRNHHPWAWNDTFIDGIAKVYVQRAPARQVTCRGKA